MGVGVSGRPLEISGATALRHRLQTRAGRTERIRSGSARPLGSIVSGCRSRSEDPCRQLRQSRQFLDEIEKLGGKKYTSTLPSSFGPDGRLRPSTQLEEVDTAFRVIADHIRTLSFAIADGITPSNEGRGYVLRRILRRAVRYGRMLGFHEPFFYKIASVLADTMGLVFPELRAKQDQIEEVIQREEVAFNKTLDRGIA